MKADNFRLVRKLIDAVSPSGCESPAALVFSQELPGIRIERDCIGNTSAIITPRRSLGKIMLAAHSDEIGLMVKYIDEDGFVYFSPVGAIDPGVLIGVRVTMINGSGKQIHGVIGKKPIHLMDAKERERAASMDDLFIDIGCRKKSEAEKLLAVGDTGIVEFSLDFLQKDRIAGRGLDDRIALYVIIEVMKRLHKEKNKLNFEVFGVATTQEEVGHRGAQVSSFNINPDCCLVIDVTHDTSYPGSSKQKDGDVTLGLGPCICRGPILHPLLTSMIEQFAKLKKIPLQVDIGTRSTGTDSDHIQNNCGGIATALLEIPLRYMHTPSEMIAMGDVEKLIDLITGFILSLKTKPDFRV
ncbi:MAG: M20/M25/M40 family metallo-hydrolase [Candidatus Wallbacteria bacterium]|nr:M20/M25/M40 family metallo-hydrolase [Candidatus Wallbacteria bacterium]